MSLSLSVLTQRNSNRALWTDENPSTNTVSPYWPQSLVNCSKNAPNRPISRWRRLGLGNPLKNAAIKRSIFSCQVGPTTLKRPCTSRASSQKRRFSTKTRDGTSTSVQASNTTRCTARARGQIETSLPLNFKQHQEIMGFFVVRIVSPPMTVDDSSLPHSWGRPQEIKVHQEIQDLKKKPFSKITGKPLGELRAYYILYLQETVKDETKRIGHRATASYPISERHSTGTWR